MKLLFLRSCETKNILFESTTTASAGLLTNFAWDFVDGSATVIKNSPKSFSHIFGVAGNYLVALQVTTSNGCASAVKKCW